MICQLVSSQPPPRLTCLHDAMSKSSAGPQVGAQAETDIQLAGLRQA
jgi:hypothetical protein